eukprot:TRINITY_DN5772_c0_g2_i1.p1 TRINITY_DN5772_c0_g2~~TRINITY_DN5772_c0_g2_i1.p1  ORF type:complete len:447 (+),score=83.96 TRINITY_DN5772_c0_g2_i1:52-1392(+)
MAAVVFAGARAATLVLQLIGYRVAGTMALASIGPTLLTAAVRLLGGPLAYIPPSLLTAAARRVSGAPMVMLLGQGSATTGFVVRAALVVLNTVADGVKYMVINLAASQATKAIRALINRAIYGAEPEPTVKAIPNMATIRIIENYDASKQPALSPAQKDARRREEQKMQQISSSASSSSSSSSSGNLPPPAALGTRVTDGVQLQVVECSNDELEKLMASIQLPPTHDPRVPKDNASPPARVAVPAMVDADRLAAVLDRSVRKLEESVGDYGYPKLDELSFDDVQDVPLTSNPALEKVEWVLAQSIMSEEQHQQQQQPGMKLQQPQGADVNLLRSRLQPSALPTEPHQPFGSPTARFTVPPESLIASWFEMPPSAPPLSISDFEMITSPKDIKERSNDDLALQELLDDDDPFIPDGAAPSSNNTSSKFLGTRSQPVDARPFAESKKL